MRHTIIAFLTAVLTLSGGALSQASNEAAIVSAGDLNAACTSNTDTDVCTAYIAGFARGFYYAAVSSKAGYVPCLSGNIADGEARSIVTKFMAAHSEMMQQRAPSVVAEAMVSAYPCAKA